MATFLLERRIRDLGKGAFGMWAFKAHHGLSKPIVGFFLFRKLAPIFLEAPNLWVLCRRRFFCVRKMAPIFLEAPNLWVRCRRRFFPRKIAPICLEAPNLWVPCRRRFFPQKNGPWIFEVTWVSLVWVCDPLLTKTGVINPH